MSNSAEYRVAIDIGGTFTDGVLMEVASGQMWFGKTLTTPAAPEEGAVRVLHELAEAGGISPADVSRCIHGTTLVINALLQRTGADVALITTQGFRDVIEIARERNYDVHDLFALRHDPLVPRERRYEVEERITVGGETLVPLDEDRARALISELAADGVESVAIVLLHSYRDPAHEERLAELVREQLPDVSMSLSSVVAPEVREFERTVTTAGNAYVQPPMRRYLPRLVNGLADAGVRGDLVLMTSVGGVSSVEVALDKPLTLIESGPAGGVFAAGYFGRDVAADHLIAFDMGGTTAKAALIKDGAPTLSYELEVARADPFKPGSGFPVLVPSVDLLEMGAGGGSIAHLDSVGLLQIGPESAGAVPGPASYGRGGERPTVTDAAVCLGYIGADSFLGGEMALDADAAAAAIRTHVGEPLGLTDTEAAYGIHELVVEQMAEGVRAFVAERSLDHRRCTLVATGGAGPLHAYLLAKKLGISQVVVGKGTGVASAAGLLIAPPKGERVRGRYVELSTLASEELLPMFEEMRAEITAELAEQGVRAEDITWEAMSDLRYVGQGSELTVSLPGFDGASLTGPAITAAFEASYVELFGRLLGDIEIEGHAWRLRGTGPSVLDAADPDAVAAWRAAASAEVPPARTRPVYFGAIGEYRDTAVYRRSELPAGFSQEGPMILEDRESTIVVGPDAHARIDADGNLLMTLSDSGAV